MVHEINPTTEPGPVNNRLNFYVRTKANEYTFTIRKTAAPVPGRALPRLQKGSNMTAKVSLEGLYRVQGRVLSCPDKEFTLVISHRKTTTATKPPAYIVAKAEPCCPFSDTGKRDQYISSVYPVPGQPFSRIEYQGMQFIFEYTTEGAEIRQMSPSIKRHL